jgi:pyruvate dehydrogenase E2 component (dihydrolipoamide acetyltransferase)
MSISILMPALSPTMTEGNLIKWHKKEGDTIKSGQLLAEIETDKATMEVEAVDEGILAKILVPEGTQNVKVNAIIAVLAEKGEDISKISIPTEAPTINSPVAAPSAKEVPAPQTPIVQTTSTSDRVIATPLAKRIAKDKGIDLKTLHGSGPGGRIVKADLESYRPTLSIQKAEYVDQPLSNMRKIIAKRLSESKQTIPHFYLTVDCNLNKLLEVRSQINQALDPVKISVNDFIIKAFALALEKVPQTNVMWMESHLRVFGSVDISVAVSIEGGLITPVLKNANLKSLKEISLEMKELAKRAREGKLKPEEYQGGSMTISNLGMYGIDEFSAIINPPQSGILAIGRASEQTIVENGQIKTASILKATLSIDHRAIDGAVGAELISAFRHFVENPLTILV